MRKFWSSGLVLAFFCVPAAHAQTADTAQSRMLPQLRGWYVQADFDAMSMGLPEFRAPVTAYDGVSPSSLPLPSLGSSRVNLFGGAGTLGYLLPPGAVPDYLGQRPRLELFGGAATGRAERDVSAAVDPATFFFPTFASLDGSVVFFGSPAQRISEEIAINTTRWHLGLRFKTDVALMPQWRLVPEIAVLGGQTTTHYGFSQTNEVIGGVFFDRYTLDARFRTAQAGGHVGMKVVYDATPWLAFHFGGRAGGAHKSTRLTASDCFGVLSLASEPGCNANIFRTSIEETRDAAAFIGAAFGGATIRWGSVAFTLSGGAEYDSKVPTLGSTIPASFIAATNAPATIRFVGRANYFGTARLVISFE